MGMALNVAVDEHCCSKTLKHIQLMTGKVAHTKRFNQDYLPTDVAIPIG